MINMAGDRMNENQVVIADADILISLFYIHDINHERVLGSVERLLTDSWVIKYPNSAILETITFLRRALNKPEIAAEVNRRYLNGEFDVIYVDETIQKLASEIFAKEKSKKNTIFDAIVLATAKITKADGIFSFDIWYKKQGMKTVSDLI